jgi:uncharacterized protein (TIGR00255 family)
MTNPEFSSMTGFARIAGQGEWGSYVWEAKSVNGKGLDLRINTPSGFETVEKAIKAYGSELFSRGSFQIGLKLEMNAGQMDVIVNEDVLASLMAAYERADGTMATGPALATLMGMKGVVETKAAAISAISDDVEVIDAIIASGRNVLEALKADRLAEGAKLHAMLSAQLNDVAQYTAQATGYAPEQAQAMSARYRQRMTELDIDKAVTDERLAAEIAVLAAKADVREELDRLVAHVSSGRNLLDANEAVGRNLGFLAQELNREANTLCAKSASMDLTNTGLALKSVIDQFKEQAANVE